MLIRRRCFENYTICGKKDMIVMNNVQRIAKSVHVADLEIRCTFVNLPPQYSYIKIKNHGKRFQKSRGQKTFTRRL